MHARLVCRLRKALARVGFILVSALVVVGGTSGAAFGDSDADRGQALAARGRQLALTGQCPEALGDLERARGLRPDDAELALLVGQCRIATRDYVAAHAALQDAKRLDPELVDVDLHDGVALYHMGDYAGAWSALQLARGRVSAAGVADLELYSGLLLYERGDHREAALAFERARQADEAHVEPVASFYAGVAWQGEGEIELARENYRRVIALDGEDGPWGSKARELLAGESLADRSWLRARLGVEYDSNVALASEGITLPSTISGRSDGRVVWGANAGVELFRARGWSGGVAGSYYGNAHFDLTEFNTNYPVATVWLDRELDARSFLRGRYDIGYGWLGGDQYVLTQDASLGWHRNWGRFGNSEVAALWDFLGFKFDLDLLSPDPATAAQRDRSGQGVGAALRHRIEIGALRSDFIRRFEAHGSYTYQRYWAKGSDWDSHLHELRLGFESLLPWKLEYDVWGSVGFMPFDSISSYPEPGVPLPGTLSDARNDFIGQVGADLERPIFDHLSVSARYNYLRNESNVTVFDYSRHVVGGYVNATF